MQVFLDKIGNIIILILSVYLLLLKTKIIKYPNEKLSIKLKIFDDKRLSWIYIIGLIIVIISMLIEIFE